MKKASLNEGKERKDSKEGVHFVIKRSGRKMAFCPEKIALAVTKAFVVTGEGSRLDATRVSKKVTSLFEKEARKYKKETGKPLIPHIEDVQDAVEKVLMILDFDETAKAYILYREQRRQVRDAKNSLDQAVNLVDNYLGELDWKTKENANMAYSLQGLNNYISSAVSAKYWMNRIYPVEIRDAHERGDFHIHDLQTVSAYCCGWDFQDILRVGFTGVEGKVSCSPPKHLGVALGQMVNFIYTLQGEAAGAEAFSNFDTLLAPFVRYDKLTYKQVKQEMQSFVFNMNVSTRVGFQTPFSNITLDMTPPSTLKDEKVVIGGKPQKETYGEFQKEMDM
ncbi:MAG: ribonucleoside triphosphate reductase, partial [Candidatus Moranbacteria bacterium]|nr:ribonucleoside triphosphate reductase [Candidatus Moranbacteria bacterium]